MTVLYGVYRRGLDEHNALDFPLLISLACDLLNRFPMVARHYDRLRKVCVDEFQDTNVSQFDLLRALVGQDPSGLFVVADDDQIVYQWNGASPERLERDQIALSYDIAGTAAELPLPCGDNRHSEQTDKPQQQPLQRLLAFWRSASESASQSRQSEELRQSRCGSRVGCRRAAESTDKREFCAVLARTKNLWSELPPLWLPKVSHTHFR